MRKKLTAQEIVNLHIESDKISDIATVEGDYRTNNREGKKINKLFTLLAHDIELAQEVYGILLDYDNITTRTEAAAACLKLSIHKNKAVQVLEELSKRNDIGIRRLNAEMTLRVWRGEFPGKTL
ncbi:MAG: hypothetical protein GX800_09940 [Clostridiaceae bacterium]|jgi:uncharacterized protein YjiS (DUF1127 family)|nr:hypothetical protein [Clostridiaceae bacterium]